MSNKATFYHAGCSICINAEQQFIRALTYDVEVVNLSEARSRVAEAEAAGVNSVPALVVDGTPFHINFGAALADLK